MGEHKKTVLVESVILRDFHKVMSKRRIESYDLDVNGCPLIYTACVHRVLSYAIDD